MVPRLTLPKQTTKCCLLRGENRYFEEIAVRFRDLNKTDAKEWCRVSESNQGHRDFQSLALPTELTRHTLYAFYI